MMKIVLKIKNRVKYFVRIVNYYFLDNYIDLLKYLNTDFSIKNSKEISKGIDGKEYNIHDAKYWDLMWSHWGDNKQKGKAYYDDIPLICNKLNLKRIIEIGCGPGYLIERFRKIDFEKYFAFDMSSESILMARKKAEGDKRFKITVDNLENIIYQINQYDCLIGIDVLEHLNSDTLNKLIRIVNRSNIFFIFVTPYLNYVPTPEHIQCYSKFKIRKILPYHKINFKPYRRYTEFMITNINVKKSMV